MLKLIYIIYSNIWYENLNTTYEKNQTWKMRFCDIDNCAFSFLII